ncbi:MAG: LysR family transcriptional regulator [Acidimicrobiales bacterium]
MTSLRPTQSPLPNLTVAQLEYLVAAVDAPTWAIAAANLGVSPSALSQGLGELERRVGLTLFEPRGRRRVPTPGASPVVAHARRVLAQTRDLVAWASSARRGEVGSLRVGMIDAAALHHFADALRAFRQERPDVDLRLTVAQSGELLDQLARGELDIVVCVLPGDPIPDVAAVPLLDEPLFVYGPGGVSATDPREWGPWVTFPPASLTRRVIVRALRAVDAQLEVVADSNQPEVLREMTRLGLGWTVLPAAQAERLPEPLRPATTAPLVARTLALARRSSALPHAAADALARELTGALTRRPSRPRLGS